MQGCKLETLTSDEILKCQIVTGVSEARVCEKLLDLDDSATVENAMETAIRAERNVLEAGRLEAKPGAEVTIINVKELDIRHIGKSDLGCLVQHFFF